MEIKPSVTEAYINLGYVYSRTGMMQQAIEVLKKAVSLDPTSVMAHHNLGSVYAVNRNYTEARNEFKRVLELDPENVSAKRMLINLGND
ncbi:TPA: tetratricopeptide repeat protein [bacterium]|nr:tetratricopeptide repeat protein [bacterium]